LNGLAYVDDAQIVSVTAEKRYAEIPRVEVEIREVGE
jgi:Holliday junction resolvase RusA-like endonuclease